MSQEQPDDPDVSDATGNDQFTETIDSGAVTFQPHGPGPTPESVPIDITMDPGTVGAYAAIPVQGQPPRFGPQRAANPIG